MKKIAVIALMTTLTATAVWAEEARRGQASKLWLGDDQEIQGKARIIERLDDRIARLQQLKGCVQAAASRYDIEICHNTFKPERPEAGQPRPEGRQQKGRPQGGQRGYVEQSQR